MIEARIHKKLIAAGGEFSLSAELNIPKGSLLTIYGPSGSGKTSLLRSLAGLLTPDKGFISYQNNTWFNSEKKINLPPQKRNIGYVFQDYALFPNMTVKENLEFASNKLNRKSTVDELLSAMHLMELENRKPDTLSGGQKQRVALARALAQKPDVLLLDEPLAALDTSMRTGLQAYILKAHKKEGLTTILVSHDVTEIMKLSDITIILQDGQISQIGPPGELFMEKHISGKFQFTGTVLQLIKQDVIYIVNVLIGKNVIKVVAHPAEIDGIQPGDKVVVASKAFNPVIYKIT
ncbi:sulfate/molybdate ABC transporter ATP-binding protein [Muriicola soli]|uniref:ATP-binding cassette domain-containing protein n=1 Tax=Muriicola soli TaxID=2507538 RepID=A0A411E7N7_9FLAO|nr:ATP-binding cassette domain-containing protein [Muriicola soli]QBA63617.1 ATP-binding cassette domain-containing protein [Muriicola soli]